jgi:hypothetical protein
MAGRHFMSQAGPLEWTRLGDLIHAYGIGPVWDDIEMLRRIFVTVRDPEWHEVPPTQWNCDVNDSLRSATIVARHVSERVDFQWRGTFKIGARGRSIRFSFEGEALRAMEVCRLGLIVLMPIDTLVGAQITTQGPGGEDTLAVSSVIAPQPMVGGLPAAMTRPFSWLKVARADFGSIELRLTGDLFEIEDQRNWGDASFKIYCTPLSLGFPREIKAGVRVAHSVDVLFTPGVTESGARASSSANLAAGHQAFPTIGVERRIVGPGLKDLGWAHWQVDLSDFEALEHSKRILDESPLERFEIAVNSTEKTIADVVRRIVPQRVRIARLLVYGEGVSLPPASSVSSWRRALDGVGVKGIPIFAATRGYFVELNRSASPLLSVETGVCFPLTATVHADDAITIAENVETIKDMAWAARHFTATSTIALVPLALHYPATKSPTFPHDLVAPWLTATIMWAAAAGIASITLASDVANATPLALLKQLIRCAGLLVTLLSDDQPRGVHVASLFDTARGSTQILAVNLNRGPSQVNLDSLNRRSRSLLLTADEHSAPAGATHVEIGGFAVQLFQCPMTSP